MLKIRALNRESSSDEDVPTIRREAQEEIALELYNKALRYQIETKHEESEEILLKLINENIPLLENNGGLPKSMSTLKYSCLINIGNIYLQREDIDKALQKYLSASELDSTDVTLWYRIGKLSLKADKYRQAAHAFSKGMECSESHWPCLDNLISVLYAIKDTIACLMYIGKALILDDGYMKGLVLRKQIYLDNPATEEYYRLCNPDYVWEPPLDTPICEDDEKDFLSEAQELCDRVTKAEKSFEPKPLQVIPLPKSLDKYTWTSLAKTITSIHKYMTDQKMSHFTMFDMNQCMSVIMDEEPVLFEVPVEVEEKEAENNNMEGPIDSENKSKAEELPERRVSQNSDNTNNDPQEHTPVQTDNDEDQTMEQDNEEQDENNDSRVEKNRNRATKRKRDVLSDLQIWGWHSKRKQPKKTNKDFTIEDAVNRIIPKTLLKNKIDEENVYQMEDSMNTMDIYNMYFDDRELNFLSPIHSPKSLTSESYFETDQEKQDVQEFWTKPRDYIDAVILVRELVFVLSKMWQYKWPSELIPLYIEAYNMFREHCDPPQVFCADHTFKELRNDALATLLYGELVLFSSESKVFLHGNAFSNLQFIAGWKEDWREEYSSFFNRFYWLQAHMLLKEDNNDLAARALQLIQEVIAEVEETSSEKYYMLLPNCLRCNLITKPITDKILKHLDLILSLSSIESLYNSENYVEVAEIIKQTFNGMSQPKVGKMGRPAQLALLMHSLWFTDMTDCFIWTEECLHEAFYNYKRPTKEDDKWEKIVEKCLAILHEIIKSETICVIDSLNEDKRCRLVETLTKIGCRQLNSENPCGIPLGCVTPWILLHYVLLREEHRTYASKHIISHNKKDKIDIPKDGSSEAQEDELQPSIAILFSAHEFLGQKGWCLTGKGELLHFMLDTILDRLDTPIFERLREKIDIHVEQALFCLYQYPSKKNKISRHLVDHNVDPLPLIWERSFQLYQYYGPDCLPEFNSYKNASISADLEQLLRRIIDLVPPECDIQNHLPKIVDYIDGIIEVVPDPIEFPNRVRAIYYLLGDFYFKQREFTRCIKFFQLDLCINPLRLDSWACLGLSYAAQLDSKLNYCEKIKSETEFLDKAKSAQICFTKALTLAPDHLILWIECGSFEYMVHSFCSRLLKYESENLSMEKFEFLENQKDMYLDSSGSNFEKAIALYEVDDSGDADERWLQYYILGKIAEKKKKEPNEFLQYYIMAINLLHENNATYPVKINYNNPQHLAVEALELHYRIHASVLKYLELHEGKDIPNAVGKLFNKSLDTSSFLKTCSSKNQTTQEVSTSFQDQFLNALKANENQQHNDAKDPVVEVTDNEITECVRQCLEDLLLNIEKSEEVNKKQNEKPGDLPKSGEETADVIMIIDSDDEEVDTSAIEVQVVKEEQHKKDIQELLDQMMEQTMKESEKLTDSNTSGTDQVEEVMLRQEDTVEIKANDTPDNQQAQNKPSDSETETDNVKTSADDSSSTTSSSSTSSSSDSDSDDDSNSSSSSSSEVHENMTNSEIQHLVDRCIQGLEICITRLPQNYKALYRLAHLFFHYKPKKDLTKCKQLLLGEYKCKEGAVVSGLFSDRKASNFFNGIWRIPSTEIDRPGSLSAHMSRCISLLLQILRTTNDNKTLMDLCMQLRRVPEPDKIYIRDSERIAFSDQALTLCIQSLRSQMKNASTMTNSHITKFMHDLYKIYQRVQKHMPAKESVFANMLVEVYKQFTKEKTNENVNVLELAIKFCQQHKVIEKQKTVQSQNQNVPFIRGSGLSSVPVHPTPSTISPAPPPAKRLSGSRPRGRPPLPKVPGQPRQSRGRSPGSAGLGSFPWQKTMFNQNFALEYLKHYQDELIKQYSQNMSVSQLAQLSQYLTQGQLNNPLTANAIANQFLTQTGLMNSSNLMKPPSIATASQLPDSLTNLPQTLQKVLKDPIPSSGSPTLNAEQLKYLGSTMSTLKSHSKSLSPVSSKSSSIHPMYSSLLPSSTVKQKTTAVTKTSSSLHGSSKYGTSDITKLNISASKQPSSPKLFKEPSPSKVHLLSKTSPDEKAPKAVLMERPNISITPTNLSTVSVMTGVSFPKPITTTSPGKTLQEKLADKKKEQQSKQLIKNIEADMFLSDGPTSTAILKHLNIQNIPSSLTVSKAAAPTYNVNKPSTTKYPNMKSPSKTPIVNYPMNPKLLSPSLAANKATTSVSAPKFPLDSGISISQVPFDKSTSKISPHPKKKEFSSKSPVNIKAVEISPVPSTTKSAKPVSSKLDLSGTLKPTLNKHKDAVSANRESKFENRTQTKPKIEILRTMDFSDKRKSSNESLSQEKPKLRVRSDLTVSSSKKLDFKSKGDQGVISSKNKNSVSASSSSLIDFTKEQDKLVGSINKEQISVIRKEVQIVKHSSSQSSGSVEQSTSEADDDIICID